jgi:hypothetical protein
VQQLIFQHARCSNAVNTSYKRQLSLHAHVVQLVSPCTGSAAW